MKKIVFGITSLTIGGAEKVLVDLANTLTDKYKVTILTIYNDEELKKELNEKVKVISIKKLNYKTSSFVTKKRLGLLFRTKYYCQKIYNKYIKDKYDIEVAFLEGPITNLFSISKNKKLYSFIHTDLTKHYSIDRCQKLIKIYEKYQKTVFVSEESKVNFSNIANNNISGDKLKVVYNYFDPERIIVKAQEQLKLPFNKDKINFLVVGRLVEAKGYERLIEVHKKISDKYNYEIFVIGEGPLKDQLSLKIKANKLTNSFHFIGKKDNPYPYIENCDYLLIPSIYEGYSMVAKEGIVLNKYILATKTGVVEALKGYPNYSICENDENSLLKLLEETLKKQPTIKKYKVKDNTIKQYIDIWEK